MKIMKRAIIIFIMLMTCMVLSRENTKIIPITSWPTVVKFEGKTYYNADTEICVKAGYRMLTAKPTTPSGKRIKSEKIIQDDKDSSKCKYDIVYEDIPEPVIPDPPVPEILTNIAHDRVSFSFTTNGSYRGVVWLDAPATNIAVGE